jgi:predicted GIY-YIG superfamily endonuclease
VGRPLIGTVYLLHFNAPFGHAKHYTGWSADLSLRLAEHAAGRGARLTEVVAAAGITWTLARTWPNKTRADERRIKNQGGAARRCPLCGTRPRSPQPDPVIALPQWTEVIENDIYRLVADCTRCKQRRGIFEFDPEQTARRVCLRCLEGDGDRIAAAEVADRGL